MKIFVLWFHHLEWLKSPPNSDLKSPVMTHVILEKKLEPQQLGVVAKPPRRSRSLRDMLQKAIIYLLGLKHVTSNKSIQVCFIETHPKSSTCGLKLVDWNVSWNLSTFFLTRFAYQLSTSPGSLDSKTRLKNLAKGAGTKDALGSWSVVGHIGMLIIIAILLT